MSDRHARAIVLALPWLLLLQLLALIAWSASTVDTNTHPVGTGCGECHLAAARTNDENAHLLVRTQETLCELCHVGAATLSHPTGVTPSFTIPGEFPLNSTGDMTCSTCHQVHDKTLRGTERGREFCLSCHDKRFFAAMADGGESLEATGHLDAFVEPPPVSDRTEVDDPSLRCMGCHLDQLDSEGYPVVWIQKNNGVVRHGKKSFNHPVGSPYQRAVSYGGYRPVAQIPPEIQLVGGRVSCISCHEAYGDGHGATLLTSSRPGLCYGCHDL